MKVEEIDNLKINNIVFRSQNQDKLNNLLNQNNKTLQDKRSNMKLDYWTLALYQKLNKIESMNSQGRINNWQNKQHLLKKLTIKIF